MPRRGTAAYSPRKHTAYSPHKNTTDTLLIGVLARVCVSHRSELSLRRCMLLLLRLRLPAVIHLLKRHKQKKTYITSNFLYTRVEEETRVYVRVRGLKYSEKVHFIAQR